MTQMLFQNDFNDSIPTFSHTSICIIKTELLFPIFKKITHLLKILFNLTCAILKNFLSLQNVKNTVFNLRYVSEFIYYLFYLCFLSSG